MAVSNTRCEHPPQGCSAPGTRSGDVSGPSTGSQESWIHPWSPSDSHCPHYLPLPIRRVMYAWGTYHDKGSHLWKEKMPQKPRSIPPIVINSSGRAAGAATSYVRVSKLQGAQDQALQCSSSYQLSWCDHDQDCANQACHGPTTISNWPSNECSSSLTPETSPTFSSSSSTNFHQSSCEPSHIYGQTLAGGHVMAEGPG